VLHVDQRRERGVRRVIERLGGGDSAGVLRDRDDLETLTLQILVNLLPTWQVAAAPSP
jgi:hypothetical protein